MPKRSGRQGFRFVSDTIPLRAILTIAKSGGLIRGQRSLPGRKKNHCLKPAVGMCRLKAWKLSAAREAFSFGKLALSSQIRPDYAARVGDLDSGRCLILGIAAPSSAAVVTRPGPGARRRPMYLLHDAAN